MKIAIIGDTHADETSRWDEHCRVMQWIADDIAARQPDIVTHSGDLFEGRSTPRERAFVAEWIRQVASVAPLAICAGNHDHEGDIAYLSRLDTVYPVYAAERPMCVLVEGPSRGLFDAPERERAVVQLMPWPRKGMLLAAAGHALSASESEEIAGDLMRDVLRGLRGEADALRGDAPIPTVLAMHGMVRGSITSTGQPLVGAGLELGLEDLALAGADMVALAHIHRSNDWMHGAVPVVYPGSPYRTSYGELEPKGYVLAEVTRGAATWKLVETPATPMVLLTGAWSGGALVVGKTAHYLGVRVDGGLVALGIVGADVRLRYEVQDQDRAAARAGAAQWREALLAAGAVAVKTEEEVRSTQVARAPAVAAATTLAEKARALWAAQGRVLTAAQSGCAVASIEAIDAEIRGAA